MGDLQEKLIDEMKAAMRAGDTRRVSVIRMLRASIKNREIEKGKSRPLSETELLEVISSGIKQRRDAIEQFTRGGRGDLVEKEQKEIEILQSFLPQPLDRTQLEAKVREAIAAVGAAGPKDFGRVMKAVMPQVAGRATGEEVSRIVKELLPG